MHFYSDRFKISIHSERNRFQLVEVLKKNTPSNVISVL